MQGRGTTAIVETADKSPRDRGWVMELLPLQEGRILIQLQKIHKL